MEASYQESYPLVGNPYGVGPASSLSLVESQRHDSGNALAANEEARLIAEVKVQAFMAKEYPRNPKKSMDNILQECLRPSLSDQATYSFERGGAMVSGPSIRLAEVLVRNWGNCVCGREVLERNTSQTPGYSVVHVYAWDLETNIKYSQKFEVKHWRTTKTGGYALKEDRDIYELEANMASRRLRAAILNIIPGDVTQSAVDQCKMVAQSDLSRRMKDPKERVNTVTHTLRLFEKLGVSQQDLEGYLGTVEKDWTADHMLRIRELKNSLDDGVLLLGDVFPRLAGTGRNDTISKEQVQELMKLIADSGRQGEISDELKKMGIAKVADVPASRFDEVMSMVLDFISAGKPENQPNKDGTQPQ